MSSIKSYLKYSSNLLLVFLFCLLANEPSAQQLPLFSQYREYHSFINPATINSDYYVYEYDISIGLSYRHQWSGDTNFPTPRTAFLRGEYIYSGGRYGFGLVSGAYLIHDDTDPISNSGLYGRLGVIYSEDPYWGLVSVGLTVGAVQYRVKTSNIRLTDYSDEAIFNAELNKVYPDVGVGVFFHKRFDSGAFKYDSFYGGVSIPQVLGLNLDFREDDNTLSLKRNQHLYTLLGFYKYLNEDSFLEPSIWIKYVENAPLNVDINLRYQLSNYVWIGAGAGINGNLHFEFGFLLGDNIGWDYTNLKIGYGYDSFYEDLAIWGPSHEINFTYTFDSEGL